jgi:hypothetical protein
MPKRGKNESYGNKIKAKFANANSKKPNKSGASTNPDRKADKNQTHMRTKAKINILNMYRDKPNM